MSQKTEHRITASGQIIRVITTEQVVTNADAIFNQLIATASPEAPSASAEPAVRSLYNLGDGVSAFRRKIGDFMYYWNSIQLENIPFQTTWELQQDPAINDGKHFICPWDGASPGSFAIGAPMTLPIPDDLIVHFHVEYRRDRSTLADVQLPAAQHLATANTELIRGMTHYYLTCFSKSRNTCISLPLPNLYPDCHLCTGSAFEPNSFYDLEKHTGLVTSTKHFLKTWADTAWNLDLLGGTRSVKMAQYRRFVRFDAASGRPLPFAGCADWGISTSQVPLEEVYLPWSRDVRAVQPTPRPEDADRVDTIEAMPEPRPAAFGEAVLREAQGG